MKTTRFLNMMAASLVGVAFMSCSSQDDVLTPAGQTYTMSVTAQKGGDETRALNLDGTTLKATWTAGDEVKVYNSTSELIGTLTAQSAGATTMLTGDLTKLPTTGDELTLKYLSPSYSAQDGTLTGSANSIDKVCDYATATVTATVSGTNVTTGAAAFQNQQTIVKFTLVDKADGTTKLTPTAFTMTDGTSTVELTNIPAGTYTTNGGDGVLYVAFPASNVSADITLTATVGTDTYTCTASSKSFTNGKYYGVTAQMAKQAAAPAGALSGVFSVSATKKVKFSKGNLQYIGSATTPYWKFAEHQYDYLGTTTGQNSNATNVDRDLFGWGTGDNPTKTSTNNADYGTFNDWGNNSDLQTSLGTGWFTLSSDEWTYLFNTRSASNRRYAKAKVNNVQGIILFPDTYTHPSGVTAPHNVNDPDVTFDSNNYSSADWTEMESAGCVFLPAAGWRDGSTVDWVGMSGSYWSATPNGTGKAYGVAFNFTILYPANGYDRNRGYSVRLVREVAAPAPAPEEDFVTFTFGTNTVKVAKMNLGATTVAESAATSYGDYYAWGATETFGTVSYTAYNAGTVTATTGHDGGYTEANAPYYNGSAYTKYTGTSSATLDDGDDVVKVKKPGYHMPTRAEMQTLYNACGGSLSSSTPTYYTKGIYKVTGGDAEVTIGSDTYKVNGLLFVQDADTHVFFPATGYIYDTNLKNAGSHGYYRSSSLDTSSAYYAYILFFGSAGANPEAYSYRHYGYSVRPFKNAE